jgi:hypothetical protein
MAKLIDEAKVYTPQQMRNIAELEFVRTDVNVEDRTFKDKEGNPFKAKVVIVDGKEYRVPFTVLKSLKAIVKEKPNLKVIRIVKDGDGINTTYTVIPLD